MGDFSKEGVHKTDGFWWVLEIFLIASKNWAPGAFILANTVIQHQIRDLMYTIVTMIESYCDMNIE